MIEQELSCLQERIRNMSRWSWQKLSNPSFNSNAPARQQLWKCSCCVVQMLLILSQHPAVNFVSASSKTECLRDKNETAGGNTVCFRGTNKETAHVPRHNRVLFHRQGPGEDIWKRLPMPVHKHSFQVHPPQDHSGCEIKQKRTSLQKCGNHVSTFPK